MIVVGYIASSWSYYGCQAVMEIQNALYQFLNAISVVHKEDRGGEVVSAASHTCSTQGHYS